MKKIQQFSFLLFLIPVILSAQTTAQDWTKTDCSGNSQNLFSYLDNNQVVVMEFGMGCSSCKTAGQNLNTMKNTYDSSNPGKVAFFYMDYTSNSCTSINSFLSSGGINFPGISGCSAQKTYYASGSPMPMIVVTGGPNHTVYYKKTSYSTSDNTNIQSAINQALTDITTGITSNSAITEDFNFFPNPANENIKINYHLDKISIVSIGIYNITGELVFKTENTEKEKGPYNETIETGNLADGIYFLQFIKNGISSSYRFVVCKK